jgi:hypothetical protein
MNEARVNNGLSIVVERKKVNCGSHPSQGPTLILERKDMELHLSKHLLHEGEGDGQNKDVPWRMNRQLTCASIRQGQKGKFRQSCPGGIALQMIAFVWQHRCDLDSRHRLRYFREDRRGPKEFDLLQGDEHI